MLPTCEEELSALRSTLECVAAQRDALKASLDQVDDVLIVNWVGPRKDGDYKKALHDLVGQGIAIENDPSVSETAKARADELDALKAENASLRNRLGDNFCWIGTPEQLEIAKALPWPEMQESCRRYHAQISSHGTSVFTGGKTIAQLEDENEKLRKDSARLDKMEGRVAASIHGPENWTFGEWMIFDPGFASDRVAHSSRAKTLREVIDNLAEAVSPDLDKS